MAEIADELYEMLEAVCPKFRNIPTTEKDVMARHMAGLGSDVIAAQVGRSPKSVADVIDRYSSLVSRVPDAQRMKLARVMLVSSMSTYAAVAADRTKINKLNPLDALKTLTEIQKVLPTMMDFEIKLLEHENKVKALNYDDFAKSLKEGK